MRRDATFWLVVAVAFVLGLLPGLGLTAYQRQVARSAVAKAGASLAEKARLASAQAITSGKLRSAEASVTSLTAAVASLTAQMTRLKPVSSAVASGSSEASRAAETSGTASAEPTHTTAPRDPVSFVNRSVAGSGKANAPLLLQVKLRGDADKVTVRLVHVQSGWTQTYELDDAGASGGVTTWKKTISTPSTAGEYRYFADAYLGGRDFAMPGVAKYAFSVR